MRKVIALILAGGQGERLSILSEKRAKPAVPFAGKYRIIDFALSNCVNSSLYDVAVLTQYRPRSLMDHIGIGKPWDLDRRTGGVKLLQPYLSRREAVWYKGTADAVYQNLDYLMDTNPDEVLILAGDHIYKMDYRPMIAFHRERQADVTVGVVQVPLEEGNRFGILFTDDDGRVIDWEEKPKKPKGTLASMGIYVFNRDILFQRLREDAERGTVRDFGKSIMPVMVEQDRTYAYAFDGYWQDVGTVDSYWQAHMDLLTSNPPLDLYDRHWLIHTRSEERSPALILGQRSVVSSLISHGCRIEGRVERSVLSPGVLVEPGAIVRESIVMFDTVIRAGAIVDRSILDKEVEIGAEAIVGWGDDYTPNRQEPQRLDTGITVVGKRSLVPARARIGRNCKIGTDLVESDFPGLEIPSGETVEVTSFEHGWERGHGPDGRSPASRQEQESPVAGG